MWAAAPKAVLQSLRRVQVARPRFAEGTRGTSCIMTGDDLISNRKLTDRANF